MARSAKNSRPRTAARVAAVQALFQSEQGGETVETIIDQFVRHRLGSLPGADSPGVEDGRMPDAHVPLFTQIVRTAVQQQDRLDGLIATALPADWPMVRLDPVLRAVLRAGGAELTMADGPPSRVVINEYLDVAHGFFAGEEPRMVNGMLDRLARELRPAEFAVQPATT
ncbi:MAG: transcription antitermination factor NusB [Acetobacteraceae bacterium]|nr:transcription antitermination factor NusB [Acetobacteraceae bacterium]